LKVLLTGATGFLGTQLLAEFLERGYQVLITKRMSTNLQPTFARFGRLEAWDTDLEGMDNLFIMHPDMDAVVHAATDYGRDGSNPTATFWANEVFPVRLLEQVIQHGIKIFVNMDTFFNSNKATYDHLAAYTLSKRHFQEWGKYCGEAGLIGFINLRLFHLYGPGDSLQKFVPSLVARCLANEEIDLTDGEQKRDFIHIIDAVAAISMILESELGQGAGYRHFDLGTGISLSVRDFIERLNILCGRGAKLNFGVLPKRKGEFPDSCAEIKKLQAIGWRPKFDIDMGIKTVIDDVHRRALNN
jgi:CDP-paratose synthetase